MDTHYILQGIFTKSTSGIPSGTPTSGQPISPTVQRYQNVPNLYIREFTNGWAVYNRSGKAQTITLPEEVTGVPPVRKVVLHTCFPIWTAKSISKSQTPLMSTVMGKSTSWIWSQVANSLGESAPDPNGDGEVNILDLVFVAQQFSQ